tara:strand:- start:614 stop:1654 length:1041 start_codon:yes stop_codon:yes gene_type:complete
MKILITGITGFVGSWLSLYLLEKGYKVSGFGLNNKQPEHIFNKVKLNKKINVKFFDIRNKKKLLDFVSSIKPDVIIHLAAQPLIIDAYNNPINTFETNVIGTINIIQSSQKLNIKKFINFTTDKVYGDTNKKNKYFSEEDFLFGSDVYPVSKICSDLISSCIYNNFQNFNWFNVRAGNIIGGGDYSENRLLPDYYRSFKNKKSLTIRQPKFIRPWQHVLPVCSNLEKIINSKNIKSTNFNLGPKKEGIKGVAEIIKLLNNINNNQVKVVVKDTIKYNEQKYLFLNSNKFNKFFKNKKKIALKSELVLTNSWYLENFISKNMFNFTINQIKSYIGKYENNNNSNTSI